MQSIEFKRFTIHRIGIAALAAIGALAIGLASTGTLIDVTGDSDGSARAVIRNTQQTTSADMARFLELNTNLPDASAKPAQNWAEAEPLELNVIPPGTTRPAVRSYDDIRYLEMNTFLPGTATPKILSYSEMLFLEANQLPGDDTPYLPIPDESQPAGPLIAY